MKFLIVLNDPPYGTERSYNGLRLAGSLGRRTPRFARVNRSSPPGAPRGSSPWRWRPRRSSPWRARGLPVTCLAHVTNAMATRPDDFDKGGHDAQEEALGLCARALAAAVAHARTRTRVLPTQP